MVALSEKPTWIGTVNVGVQTTQRWLTGDIRVDRTAPRTDLLERCKEQGERVTAWHTNGEWHEVWRPEGFARAVAPEDPENPMLCAQPSNNSPAR